MQEYASELMETSLFEGGHVGGQVGVEDEGPKKRAKMFTILVPDAWK